MNWAAHARCSFRESFAPSWLMNLELEMGTMCRGRGQQTVHPTAPTVTVLMPVYNGARFVGEAIESILRQTWTDFEFLIINDGSTDRTQEIVASTRDRR